MLPYLIIFFLTLALDFFYSTKRPPFTVFLIFCIGIGAFVGLGDMMGGDDRYIYCEIFDIQADLLQAGYPIFNPTFIKLTAPEYGYGLIYSTIAFFTRNRYIFILIYTLIMYILAAFAIYRATTRPFFGMIIFLAMMFCFSMTYLRQVMAVLIIWNAIVFVEKRNLLLYILCVLAASQVHTSAIYMIILYFIPIKKFNPVSIIIIMIILLGVGMTGITSFLASSYGNIMDQSEKSIGYAKNASNAGFRIAYFFESLLFLILLLINYSNIPNTKKFLTYANTNLLFCGMLFLFIRSSDGGRIAWYSIIGVIAITSWLCSQKRNILIYGFITVLSLLLYLRILIGWGTTVAPYKTFLTPGHMSEYYFVNAEYDYNYETDKFYR